MNPPRFLEGSGSGPIVADGGMGTSLIASGVAPDACLESLNVTAPARVEAVHRRSVEAGARLVCTNTFGGNRYRLERHGAAGQVRGFVEPAPAIARRAGAELVAGSIGPLGVRLAPYGRVSATQASDAYSEQIEALVAGGVDLLAIETQTDLLEMEQALAAARALAPSMTVLVSATFTRDDRTMLGSTPQEVSTRLVALGADLIGVNCGEGPAQVLRVIDAMLPYREGVPLVARPNAGGPREVAGRLLYPATPNYLAGYAQAFLDRGVAIVGGCCGTGPEHTAAIAEVVKAHDPTASSELATASDMADREQIVVVGTPEQPTPVTPDAPVATDLASKMRAGRFVVTVEVEPPRSISAARVVAAADTLAHAGADAIDVADSPLAKMRMSAWAACRLIQEQVGIETVLHFPTRGRNLLRLQGDLLGAHALGIRNLFVCVGDPVSIGDFPQGSNNVDVTATGLLALVSEGFNRGHDRGGAPIGEPTSFFCGAAVAPTAPNLERECRLLAKKVDAGAAFLLSQPLFDPGDLTRLRDTYELVAGRALDVPVLVGVLPLASERHASFLHNEVPGIEIPEAARDRLRKAGADTSRTGVAMAVELASQLRDAGASGVYVMPPFGRYDLAAEIVEAASDVGNAAIEN